jgi:hypothetical protein
MNSVTRVAFVLIGLAGCHGIYANPSPPVPASPPAPSREEIVKRVAGILSRARAVQVAAEEAIKLDGSDITAQVFKSVRACQLGRVSCTNAEAEAERRSKVGAQAGFADWLVDLTAGLSQEQAEPRLYNELFGGNMVVGGDRLVIGHAPPEVEPALVEARVS